MATTRKSAFKSPPPRLPQEGPSQFLDKLDPWFVGLAELFKRGAERGLAEHKRAVRTRRIEEGKGAQPTRTIPPAVHPEWPRTMGEMLKLLIALGDPGLADAMRFVQRKLPSEALTEDVNQALPNMISLLKYHTTLPELQWREIQGDRDAARQVVETTDFYNRWIHEQLPVGGVRFKTNERHNLLMIYGLPGGLARLTPQELADFFDEFCPCGETHTPEILRRLRLKLLKALDRGREAGSLIEDLRSSKNA